MTQAEVKAAIDRAFCDGIGRIFGVLTADIKQSDARNIFHTALEHHLLAHAVAIAVAEELIKA